MTVHTFDAAGNIIETSFTDVNGKVWKTTPATFAKRDAVLRAEADERAAERAAAEADRQAWAAETNGTPTTFSVTVYARTNMAAPIEIDGFESREAARDYVNVEIAKSGVPADQWTRGELHGGFYEFAECKTHGYQISEAQ